MFRRAKRLVAVALIAVFSLSVVSANAWAMLCLRADGHRAIERLHAPGSCYGPERSEGGTSGDAGVDAGAGSCFDVLITGLAVVTKRPSVPELPEERVESIRARAVEIAAAAAFLASPAFAAAPSERLDGALRLEPLRSVILLL